MPMQTSQKIILLIVALFVGVGTLFLSRGMMSQQQTAQAPTQPIIQQATQEVLVAAIDLPAGTLVKATDLKWQVWPKDDNAAGYAIKGQQDIQNYVGNVVRYGMRTGEPVTQGRTVKPGDQGFMAAALEAGKRAVSVAITPVAGVAGFVFPGDRVDVIVTHEVRPTGNSGGQAERHVSETMLKNIRVLALDQKMGDQVTEPKLAQVATLEVLPKQAETVALMTKMGTISLSLCSVATQATAEGVGGASVESQNVPEIILDAAELATQDAKNPPTLDAYTWDSDISKVVPNPSKRTAGTPQKVKVIRGQMTTDTVFDLYQQ